MRHVEDANLINGKILNDSPSFIWNSYLHILNQDKQRAVVWALVAVFFFNLISLFIFWDKVKTYSVAEVGLELLNVWSSSSSGVILFYIRRTKYAFCLFCFVFNIDHWKNEISLCSDCIVFLIHYLNHNVESLEKLSGIFTPLCFQSSILGHFPSPENGLKFGKHLAPLLWSGSRHG